MPDRAVVEFVANWIENQDLMCVETPEELAYNWREDMQRQPRSRALVAISEDRQWLVVPFPDTSKMRGMWAVLKCTWAGDFYLQDHIPDTGQSAEDVLREFLEGKDAQEAHPLPVEEHAVLLRGDLQRAEGRL